MIHEIRYPGGYTVGIVALPKLFSFLLETKLGQGPVWI
jgi:hypothetical protein